MSWARVPCGLVVLSLVAIFSCRSAPAGVPLTAPFNEYTVVGNATVSWQRSAAEGVWSYEVSVSSLLADRLFVRIGEFEALDGGGHVVGGDPTSAEGVLGGHATCALLRGDLRLSKGVEPAGFRVRSTAVPLSSLGQALYREWRVAEGRVSAGVVDGELHAMAAAATCGSR